MKLNRIISTVLAAATFLGTLLGVLPSVTTAARAGSVPAAPALEWTKDDGTIAKAQLNQMYLSAEDKVNLDPHMQEVLCDDRHALYCNPYTGEVYVRDLASGQFLTSNPFRIGDAYATDTIPSELMSQFQLTFTEKDGSSLVYGSYDWSASRGQIVPSVVGGGDTLALEYTVGDTTTRYLVPNGITREDFWNDIIIPAQTTLLTSIREMIQSRRGEIKGLVDDSLVEDETWGPKEMALNYTYELDEELAKYCEWASRQGGSWDIYQGHKIPTWHFDEVMDFIWQYEPAASVEAGENIITAFDAWYRVVYVYYKALCGKNGKNYVDYSVMGNATADYFSLCTNYALKDPNDPKLRQAQLLSMQTTYPATAEEDKEDPSILQAIYVLSEGLTNANKRKLQKTINKYAPNYTMDLMYEDEEETHMEPETETNPVFRLTLEYSLTDEGLKVSLPANSIYYDETLYTLVSIDVLPYMGAGDMNEGGYTFYPDGSGAVIDYDDFAQKNITISSPVYGQDYSFHATSGANQQAVRMPVFGSVFNEDVYTYTDVYTGRTFYVTEATYLAGQGFTYTVKQRKVDNKYTDDATGATVSETHYEYYYVTDGGVQVDLPDNGEPRYITRDGHDVFNTDYRQYCFASAADLGAYNSALAAGNTEGMEQAKTWLSNSRVMSIDPGQITVPVISKTSRTNGMFAIVEDGAALCNMSVEINGLSKNPYAASFVSFAPLPQDTYDLSEANSSASSVMFTVASGVKYLGRLNIRYVMLTDEDRAAELGTDYVASYEGMANAYRDYLTRGANAVLTPMEAEELTDQLPLYIETFGVMETTEKFLTIPITVKVALTSFDDIKAMYEELAEAGITNVKFRLTGYTNGGMDSTYPVKLKWEKKAGGRSGFRSLLRYVGDRAETGLSIFPDFEFQYLRHIRAFDGMRWKKSAARTVDNRYAFKSVYSPATQEYNSHMEGIIIAPALLVKFFDKMDRKYSRLDNDAISLTSLAADLSSSYDEDEMTLRQDAIGYTMDVLAKAASKYSVMSTGGNVYALQHVSHLLDAPIDSSHYRSTSYTVPFWGMVMHGLFQYTGTPLNEEGNPEYQILRSIESGASLFFILSYENTNLMKEDFSLSDYYSVNYQIWKEDVKSYYNVLNDAIGGLQDYTISGHKFVVGERVVEESETVAARKTLEAEYLTRLEQTVTEAMEAKENDLLVLRAFYLKSLDLISDAIIAEEIAKGDLSSAKKNDRKKELKAEMNGNYAKYLANLDEYYETLEPYIRSETIPALKDKDIRYAILDLAPDAADQAITYTYLIDAVVNRRVSLESGQKLGVTFNVDALLADALTRVGLDDHTVADVTDPQNAAYDADFAAFATSLRALCGELQAEGEIKSEAAYHSSMTVSLAALSYETAYSYVTSSVSLSEDYLPNRDYVPTVYTIDDGSIVLVTYTRDTEAVRFLLNYNVFDVRVTVGTEEMVIPAQNFIRISE